MKNKDKLLYFLACKIETRKKSPKEPWWRKAGTQCVWFCNRLSDARANNGICMFIIGAINNIDL